MKYSVVIILALLSLCSYAQKGNIIAKFCPLALFDDESFPTIQGGLEFKLSKKMTWYNEVGIKYRKSSLDNYVDTNFIKSGGFKVKTEIRYYINNKDKFSFAGNYIGVNIFFTKDKHNNQIDYYHNGDTSKTLTDAFGVTRNVWGVNFVFGHQHTLNKHMLLDYYCGFGFQVRNISTIDEEYNYKTDYSLNQSTDPNFRLWRLSTDANADEWNKVVPNFTIGLRLCFKK